MITLATRTVSPLRGLYSLQRSLIAASSHILPRTSTRVSIVSYSSTPPPTESPSSPSSQSQTTDHRRHKILNKENIKVQSGKLRTFIRKYGLIGITTYFGMYGVTLAGIYGLVSSGMIMATDAVSLFKYIHLDKLIDLDTLNPKAGNFAVAWVLTKFTEPIRFGLTIAVTPSIYRFVTGRRAAKEEDDEKHEGKDKKEDDGHKDKDKKKDKEPM